MRDRKREEQRCSCAAQYTYPRQGRTQRLFGRTRMCLAQCLRHAEQPPRPEDQDHGHHQEHQHQRRVGQYLDAEGLEDAEQHCGPEGPENAAHAAHDDHDECGGEDIEIHQQVGAALGDLNGAAQPGESGAEKQDTGKQPALVDAQRRHHLPVLRRGPDQRAPARQLEQRPQADQHQRRYCDQSQIVFGNRLVEDMGRALEARRLGADKVPPTPRPIARRPG